MRIPAVLGAVLLLAGCAHTVSDGSQQTRTRAPSTTVTSAAPSAARPLPPSGPPGPGTPISDVIAWVKAATPADAARYHSATREGATTGLGDDIAFTAPGGTVACMTDSKHASGTLSCLVDLSKPPPRPPNASGAWKGGWVDFDGASLQVGSVHGDPGAFIYGEGPELPDGQSLAFGDFRCRADHAGALCVNYAHRSAVALSAAGVEPFGCLRPVPPPEDVGAKFSCP
ncbi:hypothetical protein MSM1_19845 [Mycobacterium sp. SM1]|uniref:hypothetical protein n=1 Tax=Mycobacterium sp. SM1 TaxID=2816243 RepID=UPI001BCC7E4E|nr:hypothetical protein [Mycobacterium sp. SM1]MBS4730479.1 hypothetical protein [Mycobacterium sp. SM1]